MGTLGHPYELFRKFRFLMVINGQKAPASKLTWEGNNLIMHRGMRKEGPSLFEIVGRTTAARTRVVLAVFLDDGEIGKAWELEYSKVTNRGFASLDATEGDYAEEAVAFHDASMKSVVLTDEVKALFGELY